VTAWITKLNLTDIATVEARAQSLKRLKSIVDELQQNEIKTAVLAALEVVNQTLPALEVSELEALITKQVLDNALTEALPAFDAAANKIQTRAVDVALQGALIALTVNEKAAGNAAVQTLINRAQYELASKAPKTIKTIFASTFKAAQNDVSIMRQKLFSVIDNLFQAQREAFVWVLRKTFAILALIALLGAGLSFQSQTRVFNQRKIIR
jgi:undecaprenyl pyrophosphate synthase